VYVGNGKRFVYAYLSDGIKQIRRKLDVYENGYTTFRDIPKRFLLPYGTTYSIFFEELNGERICLPYECGNYSEFRFKVEYQSDCKEIFTFNGKCVNILPDCDIEIKVIEKKCEIVLDICNSCISMCQLDYIDTTC
jgi:hypothetical protein